MLSQRRKKDLGTRAVCGGVFYNQPASGGRDIPQKGRNRPMSKKYPAGFRLGAFSALNNGTIVGCVSDMRFREKGNVCGFAYDNGGTIRHSLALSVPKAGENSAGFCRRNRGSIAKSGFLRPFTEKEKSESEAAANAAKTAVKSSAAPRYIDENLTMADRTATVTIIYKEGGTEVRRSTMQLAQVHLLAGQLFLDEPLA